MDVVGSIYVKRAESERLKEEIAALEATRDSTERMLRQKRLELKKIVVKDDLIEDLQKLLALQRLPAVLTLEEKRLEHGRLYCKTIAELQREQDQLCDVLDQIEF